MKKKLLIISSIIFLLVIYGLWLAKEKGMCIDHNHCPYDQVCNFNNLKCNNILKSGSNKELVTISEAEELIKNNKIEKIKLTEGISEFKINNKNYITKGYIWDTLRKHNNKPLKTRMDSNFCTKTLNATIVPCVLDEIKESSENLEKLINGTLEVNIVCNCPSGKKKVGDITNTVDGAICCN